MSNPLVYIILVNWNGFDDTLECIASLKKLNYPNYKILVIDNGSREIPVFDPDILLIKTYQNLGFAEGNNVGIRYALAKGADAIWLLNNDTIVKPDALTAYINQLPYAHILGAKLMRYDQRDTFDHLGGRWNPKRGHFDLIALGAADQGQHDNPQPLDYVCGASLFATNETFKTVGLLESRFFLYWEESDWCARAKKAGFCITTCPKAVVYHKGSASMPCGKPYTTYYDWRGRLLWIRRNCSSKERLRLFKSVIAPEVYKIYKHWCLRKIQSFIKRIPHHELPKLEAAIAGIKDYTYHRTGMRIQNKS